MAQSFLRRAAVPLLAVALAAAGSLATAGGRHGKLPQLSPAAPAAFIGSCADLLSLSLPGVTFTSSELVPAGGLRLAGQDVPAHCRLLGKAAEHFSPINNLTYAIGFEMRLPLDWNGRFWHQGNGGIDGSVTTASGALGGGPRTSALLQGFAVLSTDAGHSNAQGGPLFGLDPQARLDYGYQAVGTMTPIAKAIIAAAYGKGPDRSYFGGCSNGGRHTLVAAARYADEYDGFLAGAPGYNLPLAALANIWGAQQYATVATGDPTTPPGLETAFTATERRLVAAAVLARCDKLDGAADGLVQDTKACQARFNLNRDVPTCAGARDGSCLTRAQKKVINAIAKGATISGGERFYASFPFDPGIGGNGVPFWEFTAPLALDSGAVGVIFKVPPDPGALANGAGFSLGLDIDLALAQLYATDATYTESAMSFMTPPNVRDLSALRSRGAKVIVYHGVSDPIFSVEDSVAWYRGIDHHSGGRAADFARLYPIPGMNHCSGGPATDQADFISPLVAWVEQGQAPKAVVASARGPGNAGGVNVEVPADWAPDRTRPLCPWPSVARYKGSGDMEAASSFRCQVQGERHRRR
jgi:feruloyl esterase